MACWRYWGFGGDGCKIKPLRAVYGNIDDDKAFWNKQSVWCEGVDVWITHWKYLVSNPKLKNELETNPRLFICGHSIHLKYV
jgi:hypothetical protein